MRHFFRIGCRLGFATVLALAPSLFAQSEGNEQTAKAPISTGSAHPIVVTGCLKRGNQAGTYVVTDQDGTTWELVSGNADVDLSKHIFHAVSMAGKEVPSPQQANPVTQSAANPQSDPSQHELRVLSLQVLSRSCTR